MTLGEIRDRELRDMLKLMREAVARGWCHPKNENKEMDVDLAEAIALEAARAAIGIDP